MTIWSVFPVILLTFEHTNKSCFCVLFVCNRGICGLKFFNNKMFILCGKSHFTIGKSSIYVLQVLSVHAITACLFFPRTVFCFDQYINNK